jgi:hypothetical protein
MNIDAENSLATRAHEELEVCCQTLCEKDIVSEYIKQLEDKVEKYESLLKQNGINDYLQGLIL